VLDWDSTIPSCKWFQGAKLNITENIFERRLFSHRNKVAIRWEPNNVDDSVRLFTYGELHRLVCRCVGHLESLGVQKGDRVVIYLPMVPELVISMLACARMGAIHSVVFAGFSAQALADRIKDCEARVVITADGGYRGAKFIASEDIVVESLENCPSVETLVVVPHLKLGISEASEHALAKDTTTWRRVLWCEHDDFFVANAAEMDAEDVLFILYTSGSTGKPKGVVHTTGGYMVYTEYTFKNVFQHDEGDVYWCTADIGWITGHSYLVYGPLLSGAEVVMYEGAPFHPDAGRYWHIIDKHKVTHFYTAPTAIRALQAHGADFITPYKLESLKVIGSVGEPINEDAWHWYHSNIGKMRCPVVDTWWQTETGGIMIAPLAGLTPTKPSFSTLPLPGIEPIIVDDNGVELLGRGVQGNLVIRRPWPAMIRATFGDDQRYKSTYFSRFPGLFDTGDGARRDEDGYFRILGRVDDVINVSGHRLGTAEIENAIDEHPLVVDSAVVGIPHEIKGQCIVAFIVTEASTKNESQLVQEVLEVVAQVIGPFARPERVVCISALPKTRSGKIMRRILRLIAEGKHDNLGDVSTLLNPEVVSEIKSRWGTK
jgi:acetyl-CoA synthetase